MDLLVTSWVSIELGAAWIHGIQNNPILDLSLTNKVETVTFENENVKLYSNLSSTPKNSDIDEISKQFKAYLNSQRNDRNTDESLEVTLSKFVQENKIDNFKKTIL